MSPLIPIAGAGAALLLLLTGKKANASPGGGSTLPPGFGSGAYTPPGTVTVPPAGPKYYTVASGDYPGLIAQKLTGDANRWRELTRANPQKPVWTQGEITMYEINKATPPASAQVGNFKTLYAGEKLILPEGW